MNNHIRGSFHDWNISKPENETINSNWSNSIFNISNVCGDAGLWYHRGGGDAIVRAKKF